MFGGTYAGLLMAHSVNTFAAFFWGVGGWEGGSSTSFCTGVSYTRD